MATTLTEIAPDLFRIATYVPEAGLQFNQFLIRDDEPLLFETGFRSMFEVVREQVARVVDPTKIRWIGFSHFEGDECGALNEWLQIAPAAQAVCSLVGAVIPIGREGGSHGWAGVSGRASRASVIQAQPQSCLTRFGAAASSRR